MEIHSLLRDFAHARLQIDIGLVVTCDDAIGQIAVATRTSLGRLVAILEPVVADDAWLFEQDLGALTEFPCAGRLVVDQDARALR